MVQPVVSPQKAPDYRFLFFSELLKMPACAGKITDRIGRLSDLAFMLKEPYPEAVGIFMEFGWGKPTQFIPWERVIKIEEDAVFVKPPEPGPTYPPFVDQPGWILVDQHLMGRTILDMDGRRTEVVNDVHLLETKGHLLLVHVDTSFNGIVRRWGLGGLRWIDDHFISWKYVQPLSVEDVVTTDKVSLSVTRRQLRELPSEDLADVLEELSGAEQQALFSALDSEKAAQTLIEAEPRAQRQLIATLRKERARNIFSELSVAQLADIFSVLPHDHKTELIELLPPESGRRLQAILSEREATARALMSPDFIAAQKEATVGSIIHQIRTSNREREAITYIYVVAIDGQTLLGVVDLRELMLARDTATLGDLMHSPVVAAEEDDLRDDITEMFAKYHYRMIPVVNAQDHILGVVRYNEIMKGLVTRIKD